MISFFHYCYELSAGLPTTLILSGVSIVLSACLSILFALHLKNNHSGAVRHCIQSFVTFFTGTPLLIQIFLFYSLFPFIQFNIVSMPNALYQSLSSPWIAAILALTFNCAAYSTTLFYGALKAVPKGMQEACETLGMSPFQTNKIILSYALKRSLSTYSNEIIFVVKGSALVSTITLMDITGYYSKIMSNEYDFMVLFAAAALYLLINLTLSGIMRFVEYRALRFERVRS